VLSVLFCKFPYRFFFQVPYIVRLTVTRKVASTHVLNLLGAQQVTSTGMSRTHYRLLNLKFHYYFRKTYPHNCKKHSPCWEADSCSGDQDFSVLLWNPTVQSQELSSGHNPEPAGYKAHRHKLKILLSSILSMPRTTSVLPFKSPYRHAKYQLGYREQILAIEILFMKKHKILFSNKHKILFLDKHKIQFWNMHGILFWGKHKLSSYSYRWAHRSRYQNSGASVTLL
jgi:hypothetical protein